MSSARNHAKRSHRSEGKLRSLAGYSARKAWTKQEMKPKQSAFFKTWLRQMFNRNRKNNAAENKKEI